MTHPPVHPTASAPSLLPTLRGLLDRQDVWRASTLNLIASENVLSGAATSVLVSDLHHRYAEGHPGARYYEGTKIVDEIETLVEEVCRRVFRASFADVRAISGTVSNEAVFSRLVPRGATAIAHKVATGGHISHDRMGALGKRTDKILAWPTLADGFSIDVAKAKDLIVAEKPVLVVLGRSLILFPEPVAELAEAAVSVGARVMYDGAHVLGLVAAGEFQDPLGEGADVLTGSTHKTFFGPQRGLVLSRSSDAELLKGFDRGVFPGATSNHHLHTLPALLVAALEMEAFGPAYAKAVVANAQAFAAALSRRGLPPACPEKGFTRSHQVALDVSAWGGGNEVAKRLSEQDVIVNMNLLPGEPGKNAMHPKGLRLGVQEMTRFGMGPAEMEEIARIFDEAIVGRRAVAPDVHRLRARFPEVRFGWKASDVGT